MSSDDCTQTPAKSREDLREDRNDDAEYSVDLWEELGLERDDNLPVVPDPDDIPNRPDVTDPRDPQPSADWLLGRDVIMAILSHMSVMFGVPVFLVPLLLRRNALSVHHAKAAAVIYGIFYAAFAAAIFVSPLFALLFTVMYIPGIVGIYRAVQRREAGLLGLGDIAERLFPWPVARDMEPED